MNLTTEQANALLNADPFVIVQIIFDGEGIQHGSIIEASNLSWGLEGLDDRFWADEIQPAFAQECAVTYLCHMKMEQDELPRYGAFWNVYETEILATEPWPYVAEELP